LSVKEEYGLILVQNKT